jgi:hypothetical protein
VVDSRGSRYPGAGSCAGSAAAVPGPAAAAPARQYRRRAVIDEVVSWFGCARGANCARGGEVENFEARRT